MISLMNDQPYFFGMCKAKLDFNTSKFIYFEINKSDLYHQNQISPFFRISIQICDTLYVL